MSDFITKTANYLLENDINGEYRSAIRRLGFEYDSLLLFNKSAGSDKEPDEDILEATRIALDAAKAANELFIAAAVKKKDDEVDLGFYTKAVLKTLKIAQTMLAGLLPKSPLKIGIAYNAMQFVLKFVKKKLIKKEQEKRKKLLKR